MRDVPNSGRVHACPLCGEGTIGIVGPLGYGPEVDFSTERIRLERVPELWRCDACGSRFTQNFIPARVASELYATGRSSDRWKPSPFTETHTRRVQVELSRLLRAGVRVLDVGANTGELLDFARARGCRTAGAEFSQASRTILQAKGHAVYAGIDESDGGYDVVTAFDLFEHLQEPRAYLEHCRAKLRGGGLLVLLTGDCSSVSARLAGARWWYARYPEHVVFPSRAFLARVPGFRLVRAVATAASKLHDTGWVGALRGIPSILRGRFDGLPSFGPDHVLAILEADGKR